MIEYKILFLIKYWFQDNVTWTVRAAQETYDWVWDSEEVTISAQRVGFFNIWSGQVLQKILGIGSGRSVEIYDQVNPGIFFTLKYFRVFRVFPGMSGIFRYFWVYPYILGLFSNIQ